MSLRDDDRAQAIQVGAVLLFAVLILLLSTYQAFIVPDQNREIEANHVDTVTQQLQDLRNAIVSLPGTTAGRSVTVTLGVDYPARMVALNPPPVVGSLRTVGTDDDSVEFTIEEARAVDDETADFWNGSSRAYPDGGIRYVPDYHEFQDGPVVYYENTLLTHRFDGGNLTRASQRVVDGRRLSVVSLDGSLDVSATESVAVDVEAISAADRRVALTNQSGENVSLRLASQYDADRWETELRDQDEFVDQDGHVVSVTEASIAGTPFDVVEIELEQNVTYVVRMAKAGVGTGTEAEAKAYMTDVRGDGANVQGGENATLVVETRDRYNNPVSGVTVFADVGDGSLSPSSVDTDAAGQAAFEYTAPPGSPGDVAVNFSFLGPPDADFNASTPENVSSTVHVSGGGGGGGGGGSNEFTSVSASDLAADTNGQTQDLSFTLQGDLAQGETVEIDLSDAQDATGNQIKVDYQSASSMVASGSGSIQFTQQNANTAVITYTAGTGGDADGDTVEISVSGVNTGPNGQQTDPYDAVFDRSDGGSSTTTFTVN
jgi:hypothetical protein